MISNEVEHVMQLQMNKLEAALVSWAMKLAIGTVHGEPIAENLKTVVAIAQAVRNLGNEGIANFLDRFDKLTEAAFPESLTDTVETEVAGLEIEVFSVDPKTCSHCPCTDPVCCWCGARKDGLD